MLRNSQATFNLENVNLLSNPNVNPQNGVAYIKKRVLDAQLLTHFSPIARLFYTPKGSPTKVFWYFRGACKWSIGLKRIDWSRTEITPKIRFIVDALNYRCIGSNYECLLYAYDTKIYQNWKKIEQSRKHLLSELSNLLKWSKEAVLHI